MITPRARAAARVAAAAGVALAGALLVRASGGPAPAPPPAGAVERGQLTGQPVDRPADRWVNLGNRLTLAGDLDAAEAAYRDALAADAKSAAAHYNLGRLLLQRSRHFAARRELKQTLALDPRHAAAHYFLGVADDELGLDWLARRDYRRAFELEPALADPAFNPEVGGNRQALAALLRLWSRDRAATEQELARLSLRNETIPRPDAAAPSPPSDSAGAAGGGYARVVGAQAQAGKGDATRRPARARATERATAAGIDPDARPSDRHQTLDASTLRGQNGFVNQVVAPGATGGRAPAPSRNLPGKGFGSPFNPPPAPFQPSFDSTGRIEESLQSVDPSRFAAAG